MQESAIFTIPATPTPVRSFRTDAGNPGGFAHLPALDGVRGFAILLVLFFHLFWMNSEAATGILKPIAAIWRSSYAGVNLFFALSGFLITGILIDTLDVPHYFRTFYARRSLRIFPLYYAALLALLLLTRVLHFNWHGWAPYFLTYTSNLALWRTQVPLNLGFFDINHFWSLQVEEQFYLVWPFLIFRMRRLSTIVAVSLSGCALILGLRLFFDLMSTHPPFTWPYLVYSPTFSCADNILFGCCLAALIRTSWRDRVLRWAPRVFFACAAVLFVYGIRNGGLDWRPDPPATHLFFMPTFGFSLLGLGFAALICMNLVKGSLTARIFSNAVLRFFGRYSYGLYVFHYSIAGFIMLPLRHLVDVRLHSKPLGVLLPALVVGAVSILAALASYHFFEAPILRLKKYFSYNRASRPPAIEQPA
jgi:peptidoglycan/LPS O-acetylase OafA/YrhL